VAIDQLYVTQKIEVNGAGLGDIAASGAQSLEVRTRRGRLGVAKHRLLVGQQTRRLAISRSIISLSSASPSFDKESPRFNRRLAEVEPPPGRLGVLRQVAAELLPEVERALLDLFGCRPNSRVTSRQIGATAPEIGVSSRAIFEARQIRDAEKADPGIVKRTPDEQIERGEEPTDFYHVSRFGRQGLAEQNVDRGDASSFFSSRLE